MEREPVSNRWWKKLVKQKERYHFCIATARLVPGSKFAWRRKGRKAFPFKQGRYLSPFHLFPFVPFLNDFFSLFSFLLISNPHLLLFSSSRLFEDFQNLSRICNGCKFGYLWQVLNGALSKPIQRRSTTRASPFMKFFMGFLKSLS